LHLRVGFWFKDPFHEELIAYLGFLVEVILSCESLHLDYHLIAFKLGAGASKLVFFDLDAVDGRSVMEEGPSQSKLPVALIVA
jgi:hypothetical protein